MPTAQELREQLNETRNQFLGRQQHLLSARAHDLERQLREAELEEGRVAFEELHARAAAAQQRYFAARDKVEACVAKLLQQPLLHELLESQHECARLVQAVEVADSAYPVRLAQRKRLLRLRPNGEAEYVFEYRNPGLVSFANEEEKQDWLATLLDATARAIVADGRVKLSAPAPSK